MSETYPNYELIVSEVHDYCNLQTFACKNSTLIMPINQESFMYDITTIPVPYHMNENRLMKLKVSILILRLSQQQKS